MKNCNILITGQIGTGKTSLAKRLLSSCPRALVLDPVGDYDESFGYVSENLKEAIDVFVESRRGPMKLIYRGEKDSDYSTMLTLAEASQKEERHAPLAIFFEEASNYSTLHNALPEMLRVFRLGRRWKINSVSVVQRDTEIHPTIRMCTQLWVSTQQIKLSSDYKALFDERDVRALTPFTPLTKIEQGKHYLTCPDSVDLFETWKAINLH